MVHRCLSGAEGSGVEPEPAGASTPLSPRLIVKCVKGDMNPVELLKIIRRLICYLCYMKKLVVLSGAGISQESGISTFRDANGLWNNYRIEEVASPVAKRAHRSGRTSSGSAKMFLKL